MDIRSAAARFYDFSPGFPPDVPFYQALIPSPMAAVLEPGCGTGRVTLPLAAHCRFIHGIDLSPAMIQLCREKLAKAHIPDRRPRVDEEHGVLYPELIYRRYEGTILQEEAVLSLVMRCYWPDTFANLVTAHSFQIVNRWGGYVSERYEEGSELVLQFQAGG